MVNEIKFDQKKNFENFHNKSFLFEFINNQKQIETKVYSIRIY